MFMISLFIQMSRGKLTVRKILRGTKNILYHIEPVREEWKAKEHLDALAIPTGSLGIMTSFAEQLVASAKT